MPASYPVSLKVFTARVDGEVVYAAHVNELQEEIAAIEAELGTDPSGGSYTTVKARIEGVETLAAGTGHAHDHGNLTGLGDDDHTQYVLESTATTKGDLLAATGAGVLARLGAGANGTYLVADSAQATGLRWATPDSNTLSVTIVDAKGDLLVGSGADAIARLAPGTDTQVLTADAAAPLGVKWAALPASSDGTATLTTKGDLLTRSASGLARVPVGADGAPLIANSADAEGFTWGGANLDMGRYDLTQMRLTSYAEALTSHTGTGTKNLIAGGLNRLSAMTGAITIAFSTGLNPIAGAATGVYTVTLLLEQDATLRTITWPASVKWPGGTAPTFAINTVNLLTFVGHSSTTPTAWYAGSPLLDIK